ncbi:hypothetical protein BDD12DRAFT_874826 [Trichophaea hybrida]|nr:hypothetical protein BDD12DRAFT_874826 [Trichophaea hybrida]
MIKCVDFGALIKSHENYWDGMRYDESGIPVHVPQAPRNDGDDENEPSSGEDRGTGGKIPQILVITIESQKEKPPPTATRARHLAMTVAFLNRQLEQWTRVVLWKSSKFPRVWPPILKIFHGPPESPRSWALTALEKMYCFSVVPHPDPLDEQALRSWNRDAHTTWRQEYEEEPVVDLAKVTDAVLNYGVDGLTSPTQCSEAARPAANRPVDRQSGQI